jgi:hypothetical protein
MYQAYIEPKCRPGILGLVIHTDAAGIISNEE